jgi:mRNA-degrading endonuclease RelE of RelBE toxin-antitoxin system
MRVIFLKEFENSFSVLPKHIQKKFNQKFTFLVENSRHPSLHCKRVRRTADIWEARVDIQFRMTFQIHENTLIMRRIGNHDETLKNP